VSTPLEFTIAARDEGSSARTGLMTVRGHTFETPAFMPVGTAASVKGAMPRDVAETGSGILLCNTYHLHLRPGSGLVAGLGGLHRFMGWEGAILTDSGGFQVYSLSDLNRIDDDGMTIKSHLDGSIHRFEPESVVITQHELGSDIMMAFDQCVPHAAPAAEVLRALERTTDWARRCKEQHARLGSTAALFGIVQGGIDPVLRRRSCEEIRAIGFPGYAVGGLSVGEGKEIMHDILAATAPHLPDDSPRYLMGVGPPDDIVNAVAAGVDMFDCVIPTRNARNASLFTSEGTLKMRNESLKDDPGPPDPACSCPTCRRFSRAYLRHLFNAREMLGPILATIHNLHYFQDIMRGVRQSIAEGRFGSFRKEIASRHGRPA
jgi:queuine tRNA-ribosyltransferase